MTSKNYYNWSENGPQNSGIAKNKDFVGSDHYYSEVQYYHNAYDDATLTRNVYLPPTLPAIAARVRIAPADYQSTSLPQRSQNPSIGGFIPSHPIPVCSTSTLMICGADLWFDDCIKSESNI